VVVRSRHTHDDHRHRSGWPALKARNAIALATAVQGLQVEG
jgi:hypothetical protein